MTAFTVTLLGDLTSTAFGATPTYTDYSAYLELGGDGQPIEVPWGKGDEHAEVEPSTFSFILNNTDGRFTTGASIITTTHRFKVQVTVNATTYDVVTGYVDNVEAAWPGGVQQWSTIRVTCTDVSARLGEGAPLRSFYEHQAQLYGATAIYPLSEPTGATSFGNITSTPLPAGYATTSKYGGTVTAGADPIIDDDLPSVAFDRDADLRAGAVILPPLLPSTGPYSIAVAFVCPAVKDTAQTIWQTARVGPAGVVNSTSSLSINALGELAFNVVPDNDTTGFGSSSYFPSGLRVTDGRLHVAVCSLKADRRTTRLVLDGVEAPLFSDYGSAMPINRQAGAPIVLGASLPVTGLYAFGLIGSIAMVAIWPGTELTLAQSQQLYLAAQGFPTDRSDVRFARIASYGGVTTSGLPTGRAVMGAQPLSGITAVEALRTVARTEGTDTLVTGTGALTFQARNVRYWPTSALTLDAGTSGDLGADLVVRKDRQGFINDSTYTRYQGASQRFTDTASVTAAGRKSGPGGDVAPLSDFDALQHAAWEVTTGKTVTNRLSTISVDLLAQPTASKVQATLGLTVSSLVTITGLPSQTPGGTSTTQYVEGGRLVVGASEFRAEFYTSPASVVPQTLRADGSASARTKLDAGLKVPF